jgi:hypothetical protein
MGTALNRVESIVNPEASLALFEVTRDEKDMVDC